MLFLDFEVDEYKNRLARTQNKMAEQGLDGLVVTDESNIIYLTGNSTILYSRRFLYSSTKRTSCPTRMHGRLSTRR